MNYDLKKESKRLHKLWLKRQQPPTPDQQADQLMRSMDKMTRAIRQLDFKKLIPQKRIRLHMSLYSNLKFIKDWVKQNEPRELQ